MIGPIISLASFLLVQAGAAIWWASRMSADMRAMTSAVAKLTEKVERLESSVTTHETAIAILRAMNEYQRREHANGVSHERA